MPHSLLDAPVTLFRLQMDHSTDRTKEGMMTCESDSLKGATKTKQWRRHKPKPLPQTQRWRSIVLKRNWRDSWLKQRMTRRKRRKRTRPPKDRMKDEERCSSTAKYELQPEVPCSCPMVVEQPEQNPSQHVRHTTLIREMNGICCLQELAVAVMPCGTTFLRMEFMSWSLASITK